MQAFKDGRLIDYLVHKEHPEAIQLESQRGKVNAVRSVLKLA
jgi:hypothetical protein